MGNSEKEYWDKVAYEFDAFYNEGKGVFKRAIDKVFGKGMAERFKLTLEECKNVNGKKILDIGCGSGRLSIELAKRGARVVGIDFSQNMLNMATSMAKQQRLEDRCTFILDDFVNHAFNEHFDISTALGFFDYIQDPSIYLRKMRSLTTEKCIMSFPSKFAFQAPIGMIWLRSRNCSVYFFTKKELKRLFALELPTFEAQGAGDLDERLTCS